MFLFITGYTIAKFSRHPLRRGVIFPSAFEFMFYAKTYVFVVIYGRAPDAVNLVLVALLPHLDSVAMDIYINL